MGLNLSNRQIAAELEMSEPQIHEMTTTLRNGRLVMCVLDNVRQVTIQPIIEKFIKPGTRVNTDEYDIYCRLTEWGYDHKTVCHDGLSGGEWRVRP